MLRHRAMTGAVSSTQRRLLSSSWSTKRSLCRGQQEPGTTDRGERFFFRNGGPARSDERDRCVLRRAWRFLAITFVIGACTIPVLSWNPSPEEINAAAERARQFLREKRHSDLRRTRRDTGGGASAPGRSSGCPFAAQQHGHSRRATRAAVQHAEVARLFEETTRELMRSGEEARQDASSLAGASLSGTALADACPQPNLACNTNKRYREADGSCNNLQHPGWGRAGSCMTRLLSPAYSDGVSKPRVAADGSALPNARKISYTVHPDVNNPATDITHMVMQFGQFLDHDFALAPLEPDPQEIVNLGNPNNVIDCCSPSTTSMAECFSIAIPADDPFFAAFGKTCMNMPRSAPCTRCTLGYREQQDILTSYIDASQIYGSSQNDTTRLRLLQGGLLKYQQTPQAGTLLPRSFYPNMDRCSDPQRSRYCFRAGDERVNEHPGLTSVHTIWLRHHNLLARYIGQYVNANDETLFQLVNDTVNGLFTFDLQENYFFPFNFYNGDLDDVILGLVKQRAQTFEKFVTTGVTRHLYRLRNESFGLDLVALNIQRAREHGIRPYVDYVKFCGNIDITSFDQLKQYIDNNVVELYKQLYKNVRDIDLFTAGISEFSVNGGVVGPTFACILGNLFRRTKYGDRFYYEHGGQAGSFSSAQLNEIRKTTFARILCDASDSIQSLPRNVFRPVGSSNPSRPCAVVPRTDVFKWLVPRRRRY
ncbi:salivary peroxidase/catechol oxidase-like isoform X7 [Dermacentor variabilis]|uniref:salivary peroxidase/catechol oxidase-like isoform X7 n=1 Tax=Dermacentor variabilis TaxID=34621 RepID=UPI003F5BA579